MQKIQIIYQNQLGSTNTVLRGIVKRDMPDEGLFLYTGEQTAGRGCGSNIWESEKDKNLLVSFLLKPVFIAPESQFVITQLVSLALKDTVNQLLQETHLACVKWPNDIYVEDRKIAGVLIENDIFQNQISNSIVGIGLNVNQEIFLSDAPNPVSLKMMGGKEFSVQQCLKVFIEKMQARYENLKIKGAESLSSAYLAALYRMGALTQYENRNTSKCFMGRIQGIDAYGRLVIEKESGEKVVFDFKEVKFL